MQLQVTISRRGLVRFVGVLMVAAAIALVAIGIRAIASPELPDGVDPDGYHAVTLRSGEIYFGRLDIEDDGTLVLRKAHFIRERPASKDGDEPTREVVSVREQLYQPKDDIVLPDDAVTGIQHLDEDSPVVEAIRGGHSSGGRSDDASTPGASTRK